MPEKKLWVCLSCNGVMEKVSPICVGMQQAPHPDAPLIPVHRWLCQCQKCKTIIVRDP